MTTPIRSLEMQGSFTFGSGSRLDGLASGSGQESRLEDRPNRRVAFCGWLQSGSASGSNDLATFLTRLQRQLDDTDRADSVIQKLVGNFSLVYVGLEYDRILLHREITSLHPVYFVQTTDGVVWDTDLSRLSKKRGLGVEDLDASRLAELVLLDSTSPEATIFSSVERLPAGTTLTWDARGKRTERNPSLEFEKRTNLSQKEEAEHLRALLRQSAQRAIAPSDDVAVLCSGGLDSAVALAEIEATGARATAHTWSFDSLPQLVKGRQYAAAVAAALGVPHMVTDFSDSIGEGGDYLHAARTSSLPSDPVLAQMLVPYSHQSDGPPNVVSSGLMTDLLLDCDSSDYIKALGLRVLNPFVSGLAPWQVPKLYWKTILRPAAQQDSFVSQALPLDRVSLWARAWAVEQARSLLVDRYRAFSDEYVGPAAGAYRALRLATEHYSMNAFVQECRARGGLYVDLFADDDVVNFCLALDPRHRVQLVNGRVRRKPTLRLAYEDLLPAATLNRKLNGPDSVVAHTFALRNADYLKQLLRQDSVLVDLGVIDPDGVHEALDHCDSRAVAPSLGLLLKAFALESWIKAYERGHPVGGTTDRDLSHSPSVGENETNQLHVTAEDVSVTQPRGSKFASNGHRTGREGFLALADDVRLVSYDRLHILFKEDTHRLVALNEAAFSIFELVQCSSSSTEAAEEVSARYGVDFEAAREQVEELVSRLIRQGIATLRCSPVPHSSAASESSHDV